MSYREPRQSNVKVQVVDATPLLDEMTEWMKKNLKDEADRERVKGSTTRFSKLGFVDTSKGLFVICDEGIGAWIDDAGQKFEMDFYAKFFSEDKESEGMSLLPNGRVSVGAEDIKKLPVTGEENLATFIRVFGSRIESNFNLINRELTEILSV